MENEKINKVETEVNGAVLVIRFDRPEKEQQQVECMLD